MVLGPLPPPYGGIATIVQLIRRGNYDGASVNVVETTLKNVKAAGRLFAAVRVFVRLVVFLVKYRPTDMLCFSGAFGSFWEKGFWGEVARSFGVRTAVVMVDGNFPRFERGLGKFRRRLMSSLLRRFQIVGVQSEGWLRYYRELCPAGSYTIVLGGVDANIFAPPVAPHVATDRARIVYVGWMIEDKGIYELIAAAGQLKAEQLNFRIRLIGQLFDQEFRLRQAIASNNVDDCVEVVGPVADLEGLIGEYQAADLFVLPSYAEGFPNTLLEAMAVGLPVVATNIGGIPEIVDDGVTGSLVASRDAQALATAISSILKDSSVRASMGHAARRKVLRQFTLDQALASYHELFRRMHPKAGHNEQSSERIARKEECAE